MRHNLQSRLFFYIINVKEAVIWTFLIGKLGSFNYNFGGIKV